MAFAGRKVNRDVVKLFSGKYKDNEAIEFSFDLNKDVPEDVAQEMVRSESGVLPRYHPPCQLVALVHRNNVVVPIAIRKGSVEEDELYTFRKKICAITTTTTTIKVIL